MEALCLQESVKQEHKRLKLRGEEGGCPDKSTKETYNALASPFAEHHLIPGV